MSWLLNVLGALSLGLGRGLLGLRVAARGCLFFTWDVLVEVDPAALLVAD